MYKMNDDVLPDSRDDRTPVQTGQSTKFNHRLIAPPAAPQGSVRVIQASVFNPRLIHLFFVLSVVIAECI